MTHVATKTRRRRRPKGEIRYRALALNLEGIVDPDDILAESASLPRAAREQLAIEIAALLKEGIIDGPAYTRSLRTMFELVREPESVDVRFNAFVGVLCMAWAQPDIEMFVRTAEAFAREPISEPELAFLDDWRGRARVRLDTLPNLCPDRPAPVRASRLLSLFRRARMKRTALRALGALGAAALVFAWLTP